MKKYFLIIILIILVIPSVTFASWWNPFTWKVPVKNNSPQTAPARLATTTQAKSEIEELKNQLKLESEKRQELEKKIQTTKESPKTKTQTVSPQPSTSVQKPVEQKTFTTPSGSVIDSSGNVISTPKIDQTQTTVQPTSDPTIGPRYYDSKKTCIGLSGSQYSDCVNYAFSPQVQQKETQQNTQQRTTQGETMSYTEGARARAQQDLVTEYNNAKAYIDQQIIDIKNKYYLDLEQNNNRAVPMSFIEGMAQKLLTDANNKINKLILQQQQLQLDYQIKLN